MNSLKWRVCAEVPLNIGLERIRDRGAALALASRRARAFEQRECIDFKR